MRIGILKTDSVLPELSTQFGDYPEMFSELLHGADPSLEVSVWDMVARERPEDLDHCDGWLITGSRHSVYEDLPWIHDLESLVLEIHESRRKLVAICFGHQLVAQVLGGRTGAADRGWTIGVQTMEPSNLNGKNRLFDAPCRVIHSHQDQVLELPPGACLLAGNEACPRGAFQVGEHILAIQGHPEFRPDYARALYTRRRKILGEENFNRAVDSLQGGDDAAAIAHMMIEFLKKS